MTSHMPSQPRRSVAQSTGTSVCQSTCRAEALPEAFEEARVCDVTDRVAVREGLEGEFQADGGSRPTQLRVGPSDLAALDAAELALRHPGGGRRDPLAETRGESRQVDSARATIVTSSLASVRLDATFDQPSTKVSRRRLV